jgi:hypothetical protein
VIMPLKSLTWTSSRNRGLPSGVIMCDSQEIDSALQPYRVLDLTDGECMIGARVPDGLRADV